MTIEKHTRLNPEPKLQDEGLGKSLLLDWVHDSEVTASGNPSEFFLDSGSKTDLTFSGSSAV